MPLYEYFCSDCHTKFTALRPMAKADAPIECEHCEGERTARVLSLVFAQPGGGGAEAAGMSGGCCGGACGCGHSHN